MECGVGRLERNRAVATRHDKLAVRYEATVCMPAINEWLFPLLKCARTVGPIAPDVICPLV